jgi:hypothetical protein
VLPDGFMRIRHFGFLTNRCKKKTLARCRELLGLCAELPEIEEKSTKQLMLELTGVDVTRYLIRHDGHSALTDDPAPSEAQPGPKGEVFLETFVRSQQCA